MHTHPHTHACIDTRLHTCIYTHALRQSQANTVSEIVQERSVSTDLKKKKVCGCCQDILYLTYKKLQEVTQCVNVLACVCVHVCVFPHTIPPTVCWPGQISSLWRPSYNKKVLWLRDKWLMIVLELKALRQAVFPATWFLSSSLPCFVCVMCSCLNCSPVMNSGQKYSRDKVQSTASLESRNPNPI